MHTITDIHYEEDGELTAVIRTDGRPKATIDIIVAALDTEEERSQALIDEASRLGYDGATVETDSPASALAKKRWAKTTPEERSKEMSKIAKKRWSR